MPYPSLTTSCAFTLDSSPVLLTPLSFSHWEKTKVSTRGLNKMLYKCQPLISTLSSSSAHSRLSRQPTACCCSRGAKCQTASGARPRGISYIHRHDLGIGIFLFATFRQSLVVLGDHFWQQSSQEKIFSKEKNLSKYLGEQWQENEKRSAPHGSEGLSIQTLNGRWKGETVFRITWFKKRSFIISRSTHVIPQIHAFHFLKHNHEFSVISLSELYYFFSLNFIGQIS